MNHHRGSKKKKNLERDSDVEFLENSDAIDENSFFLEELLMFSSPHAMLFKNRKDLFIT